MKNKQYQQTAQIIRKGDRERKKKTEIAKKYYHENNGIKECV